MRNTSIELAMHNGDVSDDTMQLRNTLNERFEARTTNAEFCLPPADGGRKAWLFLAACWVVEAVTYGFGFSFGVFQDYYTYNKPYAGSNSIAVIGTTTTGMLYLGAPFAVILCRLYPRQARWFTYVGLFIASLAMAMSSFCTSVEQLIATQGVLFGIGGCFAYCPCTLYINEWFIRRKGFAYGIVWSAAGVGGAVLPLILEFLLKNYGFQITARVCSGILFGMAAPLAYFIRPRLPLSTAMQRRPLDMRFITSKVFMLHQLANVVEATGYFLPTIYLPTYARITFGASTILSALTIILVNIATSIGLMIMGFLSDKLAVTTCMLISAVGVVRRQAYTALEYWYWASARLDEFDYSLVVCGGKDGFACYVRGNNQIWLLANLTSGYVDGEFGLLFLLLKSVDDSFTVIAALAESLVLKGNVFSPKLLLEMNAHHGTKAIKVLINGIKTPAVYDPVLEITIIFDASSHLPHIIRTEENHMIYGPSTNDLNLSQYKAIEGITFPTRKGFFPKDAPKRTEGLGHTHILEFSSNMLWSGPGSGIGNNTVDSIKHKNIIPGLPNTHWLIINDEFLGVKQFVFEFEDHVIVGDAPPQWTKQVMEWIDKNIGKPIKYLWPTHHHRDHSGGAAEYVEIGAKLIVLEIAASYWSSIPGAELITVNETHPYVPSDNKHQAWFIWEAQATHSIDWSYAFITDKCPTNKLGFAIIEADVWHPGMPDAKNDSVLPTYGQIRQVSELIEHTDYVYSPKSVGDWKNG
ncbi:hypothetical protein AU210_007232 [Fusarium oxysporum f. sp. radicis-cucumerinum]|uniref:Metallo-beta-lactamase domain-containing protein n=1 Tax=Fusarium oxysporum f. sp. radicis-cucumerinum TaxID=327505 RepID=A0A2H3H941_FUSOX|nr:hypothetical protein AU210_007232 [Fusarium oxysporum f. sp. radicis-cucumerinum]